MGLRDSGFALRKPCPPSDPGVLQRSSALEQRNQGKAEGPLPTASSPRTDPGFFFIKLNSHPIIVIPLKCNQWVLVYSCAIIATISFQNVFIIPKRNSAGNQLFPALPPPRPRQPRTYFLSPWICHFWTFPVNRTIQPISGLLCLASYTEHEGFKVPPG